MDIDKDMAWQVSASKPAIPESNFAGPKIHQYWSVAVNFARSKWRFLIRVSSVHSRSARKRRGETMRVIVVQCQISHLAHK